MTDKRPEGTDFSRKLAESSTLHVQSTGLNDVNCSCECSAVLQIKCHDFKHVINTHLGKVSCIGLAQHHREILWLHQRQNPVVSSGTPLGQRNTYWTLPEIYVSHQKSFFPRATESEVLQTEYVYVWQLHRWAGQATMDNSRSEGWLPSRHPTSFLGPWLHPLASAQHPFLKEYEKHETYMWVGWWEWIGTDHSQEASTWQAWGKPVRWPIRLATEEDSIWKKIKWTLMGCWWKEQRFNVYIKDSFKLGNPQVTKAWQKIAAGGIFLSLNYFTCI